MEQIFQTGAAGSMEKLRSKPPQLCEEAEGDRALERDFSVATPLIYKKLFYRKSTTLRLRKLLYYVAQCTLQKQELLRLHRQLAGRK